MKRVLLPSLLFVVTLLIVPARAAVTFCVQPEDYSAVCDDIPPPPVIRASTTCTNDFVNGTNDPSLVLHYTFDQDTAVAVDQSGYGNHGTLFGTALKPGRVQSAREFNGFSDHIRVPASPLLNVGERFTIAMWFYIYAVDNDLGMLYWTYEISTGTAMALQMLCRSSGYQWYGLGAGVNLVDVNGNDVPHILNVNTPSVGSWHHMAVTYDTSEGVGRLYLDGHPVVEEWVGHFIASTKSDVYVGGRPKTNYPETLWHGLLDDVRIYNRALSCFEIERLYNSLEGQHEVPVAYEETRDGECPGTLTRVWTATDACGSQAAVTQKVALGKFPDSDSDGLLDVYENGNGIFVSPYQTGSSPFSDDSDGDNQHDGSEVLSGTDPNNAGSRLVPVEPVDFDDDGAADPAVYTPADETVSIMTSSTSTTKARGRNAKAARAAGIYLPNIGGVTITGDFDGDTRADVGVYEDSSGLWVIYRSSLGYKTAQFGFEGTIPVPADYDGDGKTDLAVYHPASGWWYFMRSAMGFRTLQWGHGYARPIAGDYDGDGRDDPAVYDVTTGWWFIQQSAAGIAAYQFGHQGLNPVVGDYDGDGKADLAVYEPAAAKWTVLMSGGSYLQKGFGPFNSIPVSADFDKDGRTDLCSYNPRSGKWWIFRSRIGVARVFRFGTAYQSSPVGAMPPWP